MVQEHAEMSDFFVILIKFTHYASEWCAIAQKLKNLIFRRKFGYFVLQIQRNPKKDPFSLPWKYALQTATPFSDAETKHFGHKSGTRDSALG